jgi:hypothetical protein
VPDATVSAFWDGTPLQSLFPGILAEGIPTSSSPVRPVANKLMQETCPRPSTLSDSDADNRQGRVQGENSCIAGRRLDSNYHPHAGQ